MSHIRLALTFSRHRKIRSLSDAAFRLWVSSMDLAREQNEDGALEPGDLDLVPRCPPKGRKRNELVQELVSNGLWDIAESGWQIHDFLDWQDSAEVVKKKLTAARERMRAVRANKMRTEGEPGANTERTSREVTPTLREKREERRDPPKPPEGVGGGDGRIGCPADLELTAGQRSTHESAMVPGWAIDEITKRFRAQWADGSQPRTLEQWRRSLSMTVSKSWNSSTQRPKKPEAMPAEEAPKWL